MAPTPRKPTPPPLEANAVHVAVVGTVLWALAAAGLAVFGRRWPGEHRYDDWLAACVAGIVLGVAGTAFCAWRRRRLDGQVNPPSERHSRGRR